MTEIGGFGMVEPSGIEPLTSTMPLSTTHLIAPYAQEHLLSTGGTGVEQKEISVPVGPNEVEPLYRLMLLADEMVMKANKDGCKHLVYFIAPIDGGPIKIGLTADPASRFKQIQMSSPCELELIACAPGGREVESLYHTIFFKERLHGEWFEPSERLLAECKRLASMWIG